MIISLNERYCKIPRFRKYEVNTFSNIRTCDTHDNIDVYLHDNEFWTNLENDYGDIVNIKVSRIMMNTFVGELELPILYKDPENTWDTTIPNLYYKIPEYFINECIDYDEVRLCGIRFRRISKLPKYFISETGMIYGLRNKKFNSISFDKDGYRFTNLYDNNGYRKPYRISRLVFETFEHEIQPGYVIDHFYPDKNFNNIGNLTEMTILENNVKAYQMDGKVISHTKDEISEMLDLRSKGNSVYDIADKLGYPDRKKGGKNIRSLLWSIDHGYAHSDILSSYTS